MSDQLSTITNIVFIDAAVPDYRTLIAGLPNNSTYFVLDAQKDGIAQIEQYLAGYSNLDSIQILSHGSQGSLYLGNAVLSNNTLKQYQEQLANIGSHLKDTGDILLYACNVAQGDIGLQFIDALAKATGADVAASNDITGSAALGGDWVLEVSTGIIESALGCSQSILDSQSGLLATPQNLNTSPIFYDPSTYLPGLGKVYLSQGKNAANLLFVQADRKIVFAGGTSVARYNSDGTLDSTFGQNGITNTGFSSDTVITSLVIQPDGKILLGAVLGAFPSLMISAVRFNNDGSMDFSFGNGGLVIADYLQTYSTHTTSSVAVQIDGTILVAGTTDTPSKDFAFAKLNQTGMIDRSFAIAGIVHTDFNAGSYDETKCIFIQPDNKILVAGISDFNFAIARYNQDGSLDNTFDLDGKVTTTFNSYQYVHLESIAVQLDGAIFLAGWVNDQSGNSAIALVKFNSDGSLDNGFGINGKITQILALLRLYVLN